MNSNKKSATNQNEDLDAILGTKTESSQGETTSAQQDGFRYDYDDSSDVK